MQTPLIYIDCDMGDLTAAEYRRIHCRRSRRLYVRGR